jgi:hypothetical protein
MSADADALNRAAAEALRTIALPTLGSGGGDVAAALVVLESVTLGVALLAVKVGWSRAAIDGALASLPARVCQRHDEIALLDGPSAGSA